VIYLDSLDDSS